MQYTVVFIYACSCVSCNQSSKLYIHDTAFGGGGDILAEGLVDWTRLLSNLPRACFRHHALKTH